MDQLDLEWGGPEFAAFLLGLFTRSTRQPEFPVPSQLSPRYSTPEAKSSGPAPGGESGVLPRLCRPLRRWRVGERLDSSGMCIVFLFVFYS